MESALLEQERLNHLVQMEIRELTRKADEDEATEEVAEETAAVEEAAPEETEDAPAAEAAAGSSKINELKDTVNKYVEQGRSFIQKTLKKVDMGALKKQFGMDGEKSTEKAEE